MNIAIVEDDLSFGEKLKISLEQQFQDSKVILFNEKFEKVLEDQYDICFFDIVLEETTGVELSKEYHRLYTSTMLVFMSSHDHLVYDVFDSNPIFFLRKNEYDKYFNKLVIKIEELLFCKQTILATSNRKQIDVPINTIIYIEVAKNTCYIHTTKEVYTKITSLLELLELLDNCYFYRINYQEVINLDYVKQIRGKEVLLSDNLHFKISRNKRTELLQKYHEFLRKKRC